MGSNSKLSGRESFDMSVQRFPSCDLDLEQSSAQCNRNRMGPVISLQLVHDVLDVEVYSCFGNGKLIRNLLVAIPVANEAQDLKLSQRKG